MDDSHLIWCGPDNPDPKMGRGYRSILRLNTGPRDQTVFLKISNISSVLAKDIPPLVKDMLEIGSYVYSGDQSVSRGGKTLLRDGKDWVRSFHYSIPVRNPEIWNNEPLKKILKETIEFLSDDHYEFEFRRLTTDVPIDQYFDFDEGRPWYETDEILLFSGGLDSLAGAIDEIVNLNKRIILVSHRSGPKLSKWQKDLKRELARLTGVNNKILHIPVWCNKASELTKDTNQRTRSFLYAMLAASIAIMHKIHKIKFYENGIVSLNLPISRQLLGARASRSTHPAVLHGFSQLFSALTGEEFKVENPFCWKTKSEVVKVIKEANLASLVRLSNSWSHVRNADLISNHCGLCSQCIERRVATLYNDLGDNDPWEKYKMQLFADPIDAGLDRVMVESYFNHARYLEKVEPNEFFMRFGEVLRTLDKYGISTLEAAGKVYELHKRHGEQVLRVIKNQIAEHADEIARIKVNPKSLLAILIQYPAKKSNSVSGCVFPTPHGSTWEDVKMEIISRDSARIRAGEVVKIYTAIDMGFRDKRKGDLLNKQWDLLVDFAENNGVLNWGTRHEKRKLYKSIQLLKKTLQGFFQMDDSPIRDYRKDCGYATKFMIVHKISSVK